MQLLRVGHADLPGGQRAAGLLGQLQQGQPLGDVRLAAAGLCGDPPLPPATAGQLGDRLGRGQGAQVLPAPVLGHHRRERGPAGQVVTHDHRDLGQPGGAAAARRCPITITRVTPGPGRSGSPSASAAATYAARGTAVAAEDAGAASVTQATAHGAERLAQAGFTNESVAATKAGQVFSQADGATVYLNQATPGRYDFIVEGNNGVVTAHTNWPVKAVVRIASNYGWDWTP